MKRFRGELSFNDSTVVSGRISDASEHLEHVPVLIPEHSNEHFTRHVFFVTELIPVFVVLPFDLPPEGFCRSFGASKSKTILCIVTGAATCMLLEELVGLFQFGIDASHENYPPLLLSPTTASIPRPMGPPASAANTPHQA